MFAEPRPSSPGTPRGAASTFRAPSTFRAGRVSEGDADVGDISIRQAPKKRYQIVAHNIVDSKFFILFTTVLTLYALTGDDLKLLLTDKSADLIFDIMIACCIAVFGIEVVLSIIGKEDYLWGFFFYLDVISTITLVMDFSFVAEYIAGGSQEEETAGNMRSGRTARVGARIGRILRVLRLVRIMKLYKTYEEESTKKRRKGDKGKSAPIGNADTQPGEEDDWDDQEAGLENKEEQGPGQESNVGRRLSELTTRKTILLIIALMLLLQTLGLSLADQMPGSGMYGADDVLMAFEAMKASLANPTNAGLDESALYQDSMLKYIYYHNWFAYADSSKYCFKGKDKGCASMYYGHLFWIGISANTQSLVDTELPYMVLNLSRLKSWESAQVEAVYNGGYLPDTVKQSLSQPWTTICNTKTRLKNGVSLLSKEVPGVLSKTVKCPDELRSMEISRKVPSLVTDAQYDRSRLEFYFDVRPFVKMQAFYSLMLMLMLLVLLILWSLLFTYDANRLIVRPVEKMIRNVTAIRDDPLVATKMADNEFRAEEIAKAKAKRLGKDKLMMILKDLINCSCCQSKQEPMETLILEKTIVKLGSLLALGFGEAGANIIRHNMEGQESVTINAMVPGTRVNCVIGVCRVRDFTISTEVLQSKINAFVNMIAEIIHGVADEYHGAPNKNNGETFLVIWRVEQQERAKTKRMADLSIVAFSKILGAIHRSPDLAGYRRHPGLQFRLGSGCRVNVSFGLHYGWAIEGAVGSEFKIDASYLSPHVSVSFNIERVTHVYGVSLIAAESVLNLCSPNIASKCRLMDKLKISGSTDPITIYCVDLDYRTVKVDDTPPLRMHWNTKKRFQARQFLESEKNSKISSDLDPADLFEADPTIQEMRKLYTVEFFQLFNMGYQNYYQGEWQVAKRILLYTRKMILGVEDGPSCALLRFMEKPHQFEPPASWEGVRELAPQEYAQSTRRETRRKLSSTRSFAEPGVVST